jgi:uncharacterized membrane protein
VTAPSRGRTVEFVDKTQRRRQLLRFARVVLIGFGAMTWLLPVLRSTLPLGEVGHFLDGMFIMVCHRMPERTFALAGIDMPVCSRCAGILGGLALGAWIARPLPTRKTSRVLLGMAVLLMIADIITQDMGLHSVWHSSRLLTGVIVGYVASIALVAAMQRRKSQDAANPN